MVVKTKKKEEEETAQHVTFDINECFQLEPVRLGRCLLYFRMAYTSQQEELSA